MADFFTQTSNTPYDRHQYRVHYNNEKPKVFDWYEDVKMEWDYKSVSFIEILDRKKKTKSMGFS
jgi:hypothetical protein